MSLVDFGDSVLITGSSRGIGYGFVEFLAKNSSIKNIFATCRQPENAKALKDLSLAYPAIKILQMDIEDDKSIEKAKSEIFNTLQDSPLNLLVNNAGKDFIGGTILGEKPNRANLNRQFDTNTTSAIVVADAFLPLLLKARSLDKKALLVNISSALGSVSNAWKLGDEIGGIEGGQFWYAYNMSKASLNMYTRVLSKFHTNTGLIVVSIHPGRVRTDMGGPNADISIEESVETMLNSLSKLSIQDSGRCIDRFGKDILF